MSTIRVTNLQNASAASPAIVLDANSRATLNGLSYPTEGSLSGRNRIINGSFEIWQRGTSTTATGNTYLADRWVSACPTGGTVSQETSSIPTGSRYAWKYVASASNAFMQIGQQIEFANCLDLQNTTVAISFMARSVNTNAGSTSLTVRTRTIAGVDGTCYFIGSNSDTSVTLTTTWTRYTVTRTLPATFGSLSLEFVLGSHVSGDGIMLAQVQLEAGSVATPFERRTLTQEQLLCSRYYHTNVEIGTLPNKGGGTYFDGVIATVVNGGTSQATMYRFPVPMRVAPTITVWTPNNGTQGQAWSEITQSNVSYSINAGSKQFYAGNNPTGSGISGNAYYFHYAANAEL